MIRLQLLNCSEYHWEIHTQISKKRQKKSSFEFYDLEIGRFGRISPILTKKQAFFRKNKP
jgi:hypothetical protein